MTERLVGSGGAPRPSVAQRGGTLPAGRHRVKQQPTGGFILKSAVVMAMWRFSYHGLTDLNGFYGLN